MDDHSEFIEALKKDHERRVDEYEKDLSSGGTQFYRCCLCNRVVSKWDIARGGCGHCASTRIVPTNLTLMEKAVQLAKHPCFWRWE